MSDKDETQFENRYKEFAEALNAPYEGEIHPPPDEFTEEEIKTDNVLQFFHYAHLPEGLRARSAPFCRLARQLIDTTPRNPQRTIALNKLLEAKDAAVRAAI